MHIDVKLHPLKIYTFPLKHVCDHLDNKTVLSSPYSSKCKEVESTCNPAIAAAK